MKSVVLMMAGGALAASLMFAQAPSQPAAPALGQGRGGAPFAWGDKNKDGICDVTGRPVGQGRAARAAQAPGRAGGRMAMRGGRGGRWGCCAPGTGMARGWRAPQPAPAPPAQPAPKE
jgi:hypothetical protein